jgi:hypothetical protein
VTVRAPLKGVLSFPLQALFALVALKPFPLILLLALKGVSGRSVIASSQIIFDITEDPP